MTPSATVYLGKIPVGDGHPTVFVAEIGTFFNQDLALAESYIRAVAQAGAPVVKTEVLHNPDVCLKNSGLLSTFRHAGGVQTEDYRALIERKVVSLDNYRILFRLCADLKLPFIATVYDFEGVDFLAEVGAAGIKISRDNINNFMLIRRSAKSGLPLIFDAGVVYLDEVARAVRCAREAGGSGVIVNHHPGANPAPPEVHHFRVMQTYKESLGVPVGLSCHYRGEEMLYVAVGMGANLLEKGVVDDPDRVEQDLVSAASLADLPQMVRKVQNCWAAIGAAPARPKEPRDFMRRKCLVAARAVRAGETLDESNLTFCWPPVGISVENFDAVAGSVARRNLEKFQPLQWEDIRLPIVAPTIGSTFS